MNETIMIHKILDILVRRESIAIINLVEILPGIIIGYRVGLHFTKARD